MPAQINLSHNELKYLLKTVFEGAFGHKRDIGAMAETVWWLEASGLGGLEALIPVLDDLDVERGATRLDEIRKGHWEIDCQGISLITVLDPICDLLRDHAGRCGQARMDITGAKNPDALAAAARCSAHGFNVYAKWPSGKARIMAGQSHPDIFDAGSEGVTTLMVSARDEPLPDLPSSKTRRCGADELRECFDKSLTDGMDVDLADYKILTGYAARVLVPSSEASRSGAGE